MGSALALVFGLLRGALPLVGGFFTGGLSWVWSLFSAFVGTEIGSKIVIGLACVLGGFIWGFSHEHAVKERAVAEAVSAQNAEWQREIVAANAKNEERIQEALNAARNVAPAPVGRDELIRLCRQDSTCRGALGAEQRVSASKRVLGTQRQPADHH